MSRTGGDTTHRGRSSSHSSRQDDSTWLESSEQGDTRRRPTTSARRGDLNVAPLETALDLNGHPSPLDMGLPLNLNGHSYFLVPDKLGSASDLYIFSTPFRS